ncbi:MAG: hypothetical protein NBV76_02390 [Candidatus Ochrobactrum gambitense]|nr:MAG: hypothetical protein NBV76_02390 [Candidatus Ochrobactrum gambitense]WEK15563.1 MAG: hypothetical protein P0Y54_08570 [Candidatus Ochrobactrum gambitense]
MGQTIGQPARHNRRPTPSASASSLVWLRQAYFELRSRIDQWRLDRKIARTRLSIQNLPEHIRQDVGWPAIDDRLPIVRQVHSTRPNTPRKG